MAGSITSSHDVADDAADDAVSVVSSVAVESDDSSDNTRLIIILTSLVMAIAAPTLLYFFAAHQLITVGSALLNLFSQGYEAYALITGALVIGIGTFTVFSFTGAIVSYLFGDATPAENIAEVGPETLKEDDDLFLATGADGKAAVDAGVTLTLPTPPGSGSAAAPSIPPASTTGSALPVTATVPGAAPAAGTIAAGAISAPSAAVPPAAPLTPPPSAGLGLTGTSASASEVKKVKSTKKRDAAPKATDGAPIPAADAPATTDIATQQGNIPVAVRDAFNTAKRFVIQHPAACFGGASLVLISMYHLVNMFSGNDSTAAVGIGSTILSTAVNKVWTPLAVVTCLYRSPNNRTMEVPVPGVCPEGTTQQGFGGSSLLMPGMRGM